MKVVYPICCGVDVHKTFLVATIITSEGITPHYSKKRFSTFNNSILQFKQWLLPSAPNNKVGSAISFQNSSLHPSPPALSLRF